jgi:hypothetical protein
MPELMTSAESVTLRLEGRITAQTATYTWPCALDPIEFLVLPRLLAVIVVVDLAARMLLQTLEIKQAESLMPSELSGGMLKRVAIARAMALGCDVLLLAEPSAGFDPVTAANLTRTLFVGLTIEELADAHTSASIAQREHICDCGPSDHARPRSRAPSSPRTSLRTGTGPPPGHTGSRRRTRPAYRSVGFFHALPVCHGCHEFKLTVIPSVPGDDLMLSLEC